MNIVYEDSYVIVVHKEAGLATQTKKLAEKDLVSEINNHLGSGKYLGIIHRLDQNVEGLLVFAKDSKSAANLSKQVQERVFNKDYIAKVSGDIVDNNTTLVDYLLSDPKSNTTKVVSKDTKGAKRSELSYEKFEEPGYIIIHLKTGRKHQIRVQLSNAGLPIVGDVKYGGIKNHRLCLAAYHLSFIHPKSGELMDFTLPLSLTNTW